MILSLLRELQETHSFYQHRGQLRRPDGRRLKLHLGCGPKILPDWVNVDSERRDGVVMCRMPLGLRRFDSHSADYIYSSHFLEHISYPSGAYNFAAECLRILVPGGVLRIVVPGIEKILNAYIACDKDFFEVQSTMHPVSCTTKLEHLMYALQQDGEHKYGYDFETLTKLLSEVGFREIYCSDFNTSKFTALRVDYRSLKDNHGRYLSLFVDAIKSV